MLIIRYKKKKKMKKKTQKKNSDDYDVFKLTIIEIMINYNIK